MKKLSGFFIFLFSILLIGTSAYAVDITSPSASPIARDLPTYPPAELPTDLVTNSPDELNFLRESLNELFILSLPTGCAPPIAISGSLKTSPPSIFSSQYCCGMLSDIIIIESDFILEDGVETQCFLKYQMKDKLDEPIYVSRNYTLYYDREAFIMGEDVFIKGLYVETITGNDGTRIAFGKIEGQMMMFETNDFVPGISGKPLIKVTHLVERGQRIVDELLINLVFFLEPIDTFTALIVTPTPSPTPVITPNPSTDAPIATPTPSPSPTSVQAVVGENDSQDDDTPQKKEPKASRSKNNMPEPLGPGQIALASALLAAVISLSNVFSSATGSGMSSFKSKEPASSQNIVEDTAEDATQEVVEDATQATVEATTQEVVKDATQDTTAKDEANDTSSQKQQKAPSTITKTLSKTLTSFTGLIKGLLANLRDMLTDEGRSYTSSKIEEEIDTNEGK